MSHDFIAINLQLYKILKMIQVSVFGTHCVMSCEAKRVSVHVCILHRNNVAYLDRKLRPTWRKHARKQFIRQMHGNQ